MCDGWVEIEAKLNNKSRSRFGYSTLASRMAV